MDLNAFVTQPQMMSSLALENEMGTANKPPKLLRMEDYPAWATFRDICISSEL